MGTITTSDGVEVFFNDWGSGRPIVTRMYGQRGVGHSPGPSPRAVTRVPTGVATGACGNPSDDGVLRAWSPSEDS
jgi:hypothetical protein